MLAPNESHSSWRMKKRVGPSVTIITVANLDCHEGTFQQLFDGRSDRKVVRYGLLPSNRFTNDTFNSRVCLEIGNNCQHFFACQMSLAHLGKWRSVGKLR